MENGTKEGFSGCVGETPLIRLKELSDVTGCEILGKAEHMNPGGSVKDRPAKYMIEYAEKEGLLKPGGTIVEATAGNTGLGLVYVGNSKGYKTLFVCPEKVSTEKIDLLRTLGAEVQVAPIVKTGDPQHFLSVAQRRSKEIEGAFFTCQFENPHNLRAHYETTGPEIWNQTQKKIDAFICAAGTGGTIGGVSNYLKEQNPKIKCWIMDTPGSGVSFKKTDTGEIGFELKPEAQKEAEGSTLLEGIGSGSLYYPLVHAKLDGVMRSNDQIALEMTHYLLKKEGLFVGPTAGLNVVSAVWLAKLLGPGHTIVTILCDRGNGYVSKAFSPSWLEKQKIKLSRTEAQQFVDAFEESHVLLKR
eukprot:TRINITY_DN4344_c0_g1_i1.p1 TRINITY_DN4344_c0_g1~~TRINITY_DN4344_c0_g1_i1.p1  ORF type:complete len:358 (+),score=63.56 TRINITY_DN4344_c0_g1_i1:45-1118(+)